MRFQHFANWLLRLLFRFTLKLEVTGLEHVPRSGRLIVMMNHTHALDPMLTTALLRRDMRIMSKIENLRLPLLGLIVKWYGSFPIRRGEADLRALKRAIEVLEQEHALLMAPEGHRSEQAALQPAHDGMTLVATRAHAPILPVAISGAERYFPNLKRLRRTPVRVTIGEPFVFVHDGARPSRAEITQMTEEAMYRLASMLPEPYRGVYSDLSQATSEHLASYRQGASDSRNLTDFGNL